MLQRTFVGALLLLILQCSLSSAQVSVLTYHNDVARTGQNLSETLLTPTSVNQGQFGKLVSYNVDGYVVAQPLYVQNVAIPNLGTHNVVYVATLHDSVYAFDADSTDPNAAPLWQVSFINPTLGITAVSGSDAGCTNVTKFPEHGIVGTPVIDPDTGTLYVIVKTEENGTYVQRLHALDITNGQEKFSGPVVIAASVPGTGDGSTTVTFNPLNQMSRPALLLLNHTIYAAFGANGCKEVHNHGWVMAYDAQSLQQIGVFNTTPNDNNGGPWHAGSGPAADAEGNIYLETADATFDFNIGGPDFGDSILKLTEGTGGLSLADYFTPSTQVADDLNDLDVGSVGPLVLPDQPGVFPHLLVGSGKDETIYLINRDAMGSYNAAGDQIVQEVPPAFTKQRDGVATYWNGTLYFEQFSSPVLAYALNNGLLSTTPVGQTSVVYQRNNPSSISANGSTGGILWLVTGSSTNSTLRAFDPTNLVTEFYDSDQAGTRDTLSLTGHWAVPTIANGRVYVGTQTQVSFYGLAVFAPQVTLAPTSLTFAGENIGLTSSPQNITLTNTGNAALAVSNIAVIGTNSNDFGQTNNCGASIAPGGQCSISVGFAPLAAGARTATLAITDNGNGGEQDVPLSGTGIQASTTVALGADVNPSAFGQSVTLTAAITPQFGGQVTGTVNFLDGSASLGTAGVSNNTAALMVSNLAVGNHTITAAYSGDSNFTGSNSPGWPQVVNKAATTTTLAASANPGVVAQPLQFVVTVLGQFGGTPTGTVKVLMGAVVLGQAALSNGQASISYTFKTTGSKSITAKYFADANFLASTSAPLQETISRAPTTTMVSSSQNPSDFNQPVTFTATVTSAFGNPPDGELVTFKDNGVVLGKGTLSSGVAQFVTSSLKRGTQNITAAYPGDGSFAASVSAPLQQVVNRALTQVTVISNPNPAPVNQSVTLTATVIAEFSGSPTGTVKFMNGTVLLGKATLSDGQASINFTFRSNGTKAVTAAYTGDANFQASSSSDLQLIVQR
jgi:hypothetical protein